MPPATAFANPAPVPAQPETACTWTARVPEADVLATHPRRFFALRRRIPKMARSYSDPLFERPDLVEDDYYRLRNRLGR
jgi:hypothetical protein